MVPPDEEGSPYPSIGCGMRWSAVPAAVAVGVLAAGCGGDRDGLRLSVTPASALADTPFTVRVTGLGAGDRVTISVLGSSHLGKLWRGALTTRADAGGHVDLRDQYLVARLRPERKPSDDDYLPWAQNLRIVARSGNAAVTAHAQRILQPPSVTVAEERPSRVGFYGDWLTPRRARHRTAVLLMGGSNGGLPKGLTAYMLAAHGYPVLALAYFREPGLPKNLERIPLEYFRHALEWMRQRREVDPQRIVTFGVSRGGELSLILASTFRHLVHGAISYVGSDVAIVSPNDLHQPAWTYRGRPVLGPIALDRIAGPVFAVGSGGDMLWPSGFYAQNIEQDLRGHDRRDVTLVYPNAGHLVGEAVPGQPELATTGNSIYGKLSFGGSPRADEAAREDSWPKLLRFLAVV
jgi:dienelactone hydrolase